MERGSGRSRANAGSTGRAGGKPDFPLWQLVLTSNVEIDMSIKEKLVRLARDEEGLTTVEYAVAGGLIAAAVIAAFLALGETVTNEIEDIDSALNE